MEKTYPFITTAILPDELIKKELGMTFEQGWHEIYYPYDPQQLASEMAIQEGRYDRDEWNILEKKAVTDHNILEAIEAFI